MTESTPNRFHDAQAAVIGWTEELRREAGRVDAEHLAAAHAAWQELRSFPTVGPHGTVAVLLAALRAELAYAEAVKAHGRADHLAAAELAKESYDRDHGRPVPDPEIVADVRAAMGLDGAEPESWDGWSGPVPVVGDETPEDIVNRVAADLEGAADILTVLLGDDGTVPAAEAARASGNILRALTAGATVLRARLAGGPRVTVTDRSEPNAELMAELRQAMAHREEAVNENERLMRELEKTRHALAEAQREQRAQASRLGAMREERDRAEELAKKRAQTLQLRERELAEQRQRVRQLGDQLARGGYPGTRALKDVLKALGTWAPDFETQGAAELAETAVTVAKAVVADVETKRTELAGLRKTLNDIPAIQATSGALASRVRAAVDAAGTVRRQRDQALDDADLWKARAETAEREAGANAAEATAWRQRAETLEAEQAQRGPLLGAPTAQNLGHSGT